MVAVTSDNALILTLILVLFGVFPLVIVLRWDRVDRHRRHLSEELKRRGIAFLKVRYRPWFPFRQIRHIWRGYLWFTVTTPNDRELTARVRKSILLGNTVELSE